MIQQSESTITATGRILVVDDDPLVLGSLGGFLKLEGYAVSTANSVPLAIDHLQAGRYALVITDVAMPQFDGYELLRHARANHPEVEVIMLTAYGTIDSAVEAIKQGAYDFLSKPVSDEQLRMAVERALRHQRLAEENRHLKTQLSGRYNFSKVVGQDPRMAKVFELMDAVADTRTTVLVTGESGTGKSLIARAIHAASSRREQPFVDVSSGALPETLLESELFGHVRGSFTGAVGDKVGKFAAADGGTIFLDEIATASPQLQVKLLRVLQERRFEPVGSNGTIEVDVRVILATNRDLWAEVQAGRFREDLYYRINVVNIHLPPLRQRVSDVVMLAEAFLLKFVSTTGKQIVGFAPEAMALMQRYDWPGNVRELENCVEHSVVMCNDELIAPDDLPPAVADGARNPASAVRPGQAATLADALADSERRIILDALRANGGNRQATAKQLQINRTTLYKKMKRHGLMD